MKLFVYLFLFFAAVTHADPTPDKIALIETRTEEIVRRMQAAQVQTLTELTPAYLSQDILGVRRMILDVLTPSEDTERITAEDRKTYVLWARMFNRSFRPLFLDVRYQVRALPLAQKKYVPELYRMLMLRAGYRDDFTAIQWSNRVNRVNFPIALSLLRLKSRETIGMRQSYEYILDRTRKLAAFRLRLLLLDFDRMFSEDGVFQRESFEDVLTASRYSVEKRTRNLDCASQVRVN